MDEQGNNEGAGEGAVPSERVRKMEIRANEAFDVYRELYYEGGVSSVYFWNLDDGFAGVVLLKKGMFNFVLLHLVHYILGLYQQAREWDDVVGREGLGWTGLGWMMDGRMS